MTPGRIVLALALFFSAHTTAFGHQPIVSDGSAINAASAISLGDVNVSRVVYHEVTADAARLWMTFEGTAGQLLYVQLGLPAIERLTSYRPSVAILGPGLPAIDLPFEVPAGLGGILLSSSDVTNPTVFDEPFSSTRSWILLEQDIPLPQAGTYYVVAFDPAGQPGKLWVATGREEQFSLDEIGQLSGVLKQVRAFHESSAGAPCFLLPLLGFIGLMMFLAQRRAARQVPCPVGET